MTLGYGDVGLNYTLQWSDSQTLGGAEIEAADVVAGPAGFADEVYIHDISVSYDMDGFVNLYAGVNNVTDVDPYPTNRPIQSLLAADTSSLGSAFAADGGPGAGERICAAPLWLWRQR